jgi:hypothetical protein
MEEVGKQADSLEQQQQQQQAESTGPPQFAILDQADGQHVYNDMLIYAPALDKKAMRMNNLILLKARKNPEGAGGVNG